MTSISFGLQLPTFDPFRVGGGPTFLQAARLAEQAGFDAVWAGDHLAAPASNYEPTVVLAAVAAMTGRLSLGFGVLLLGLRNAAWAAKQMQAIDAMAPGRLRLGVGVGGEFPQEFEAVGLSTRQRGALLDRALEAMPALLQGRETDMRALDGIAPVHVPALRPPVHALPPVYVGGRGEPSMNRAARFGDWWMPTWLSAEQLAKRALRLGELADQHGRAQTPRIALVLGAHIDEDKTRARAHATAYTRGMYGLPFERVEKWTAYGPASRVAELVSEVVEAGVEEIVFTLMSDDPLTQVERLETVVRLCCRQ
ncbi:MAG: LLM class flavin-dependent oxidoreductase [Solirubrobacteraceae bacterium]